MLGTVYTGIDIGADSIKVLSLRAKKGGFAVLGAGIAHVPDETWNTDYPEETLSGILKRLLKSQKIPRGHVITGLSGNGCMLRYLSMPIVPKWKMGMLLSYEVEEQSGVAASTYDYRVLDLPEFEAGKFSVLLAQAQEDLLNGRSYLCSLAGIPAREMDMQCMALHNLYLASPQFDDDEVTLCLDIGKEETLLSLQQGSSLFFARSISQGGRHFTDNIRKEFEVSQDSAENLKLQSHGIIPPESGDNMLVSDEERLSNACKAEASALASAIQGAMVFFRGQALRGLGRGERLSESKEKVFRPTKVLVTGGGSLLPGLMDYLSARLRMPCELLDIEGSFSDIKSSAEIAFEDGGACQFATAAGLAISRAMPSGIGFSLITDEEKARREVREKKVPLIIAGVFALLLLIFSSLTSYGTYSVEKEYYEGMLKAIDNAKEEHKKFETELGKYSIVNNRVMALEKRLFAGRDILEALRILRDNARREFIYTNLSFQDFEEPEAEARKKAEANDPFGGGSKRDEDIIEVEDNTAGTRLSKRALVINGLCLDKTDLDALETLDGLVRQLEKSSNMFVGVKNTSSQWITDREELAGYFGGEGEVASVPVPKGALQFSITCWLKDWR